MERTGAEGLAGSPGSGGSRAVCNEGGLQLSEPGFIEACASFDRHEAEEGGIPFKENGCRLYLSAPSSVNAGSKALRFGKEL